MPKPKLSIILPVRQTKADHRDVRRLADCIKSLEAQTVRGKFEIIVADTDSDSYYKTKHAATCKDHKVKYLYEKTGQPWNISRARNIGIRAAKGEFVMVTDMDCLFAPNFIETVLCHAAAGVIVHCRIYDIPNNVSVTMDDLPRMKGISAMRPAWCYGGCQVVSREWANAVHGYDEKYELWGADDTDFMERAVGSGMKNVWIENETSYFHQWHDQWNRQSDIAQKDKNRARLKLTETRQLPIVRNPHEWGCRPSENEWDDTAVIMTAFLRDASMLRAVKSIRKFYPTIDIIVADNGRPSPEKSEWAETFDFQLIQVPFDAGVTVARNAGVKALATRHKYAVIVEDDIEFTGATLSVWRSLLDSVPEAGVVGGKLIARASLGDFEQNYEANISIEDRTAYVRRIEPPKRVDSLMACRYCFSDMVLNVFMARRKTLDALPWDEKIKSAPEHEDWFFGLKFKTPWKVIYTPDVSMIHHRDSADKEYRAYRKRMGDFEYFGAKWNVDYLWNSWNVSWGLENPQSLRTFKAAGVIPSGDPSGIEYAVGIKTFMREATLFRTIAAFQKNLTVPFRFYICDDSGRKDDRKLAKYQDMRQAGHVIIERPYDSGLSAGRNAIVAEAKEPYILITDDDIALDNQLALDRMRAVLDSRPDIGLVSAMVKSDNGQGAPAPGFAYARGAKFERIGGLLKRTPAPQRYEHAAMPDGSDTIFIFADQVPNCFLARRELFADVRWDDRIKIEYEHLDLALRLQAGGRWKSTVAVEAEATHYRSEPSIEYSMHRNSAPKAYFLQKHGLHLISNQGL